MEQRRVPWYKPGNKRCPKCGHAFGWGRLWRDTFTWGRSRWECPSCHSPLGLSVKRRLIGMLFLVVVGLALVLIPRSAPPPSWGRFLILLAALTAIYWFDSVESQDRTP